MLINIIFIITTLSIVLVVYHHVGYPVLLKLVNKFKSKTTLPELNDPLYDQEYNSSQYPAITIVMPAYNEARYIQEKIRNLAFIDYPREKLKVILGGDGCTDDTVKLAREALDEVICKGLPLEIRDFKYNRGKIAVLNDIASGIDTPIIALTDVSSLVSIDALKLAVTRFEDANVGAVNGNYRLLKPGSDGEAAYWRYQSQIKIGEEALGSVLGAHGAFYMMRTKLFRPLTRDIINDDFIVPMRAVEKGYRVVYEPRLNALELEQSDASLDWNRRLRISTGNAQQISKLRSLFHPKYGGVALAFFSGKGLRVAMPLLMLSSLFGSLILAFYSPLFTLVAGAQLSLYAVALWAHMSRSENINTIAKALHYLVVGHTASFIGSMRYFRNTKTHW